MGVDIPFKRDIFFSLLPHNIGISGNPGFEEVDQAAKGVDIMDILWHRPVLHDFEIRWFYGDSFGGDYVS